MVEPENRLSLFAEPHRQTVPVQAPVYRYLVCDLLTDKLWNSVPFTGVKFDRRVSRPGDFSGSLLISNREQALMADNLSRNCGRLAVWVMRDKVLWWGGILWNAKAGISTRSYDTVAFQGSSFESYAYRNEIDVDWAIDPSKDMTEKVVDIWAVMQTDPHANIGVTTSYANIAEQRGAFLEVAFLESDQISYGEMLEKHTDDPLNGIDYTISVYQDGTDRFKILRPTAAFKDLPVTSPAVISGYRIPSWSINRDTADMGTRFRTWVDTAASNVGEDAKPVSSNIYTADDLYAEGWPRLDVSTQLDGAFVSSTGAISYGNFYASWMKRKQSGIRDVVTYDVDLGTTQWHPNQIGQKIVVKHSKQDLWRAGETTIEYPVVASFAAPERGTPERVTFTFDNTREVFS